MDTDELGDAVGHGSSKKESYKKMEDKNLREIVAVERTRGDVDEFHDLWDVIEDAGYEVATVQGESGHFFGVFVDDGDEP